MTEATEHKSDVLELDKPEKNKFQKFVDWVNADDIVPVHEEVSDEDDGGGGHHDDHGHGHEDEHDPSEDLVEVEDFHMGALDEEFDYSEMFESEAERHAHDREAAALSEIGIRRVMLKRGVKERFKATQYFFTTLSVLLTTAIIGVLLYALSFMPTFGDPKNPTNNEVYVRYVEKGMEETGATNIVAAIILDYRAFDTFGEAFVLFTALIAVIMLVRTAGGAQSVQTAFSVNIDSKQPLMLRFMITVICPFILIYGIYILFNGHLTPGGGFSGGAILGSGLSLYAITFGAQKIRKLFSFKSIMVLIGVALTFYALVKGYAFVIGASGLHTGIPLGTPGNLFSAGLILPLNIAVGVVVSSTVYSLYALFSEGEV